MLEHQEWKGDTGGTAWMHNVLIRLFRHIDIRCVYVFMALFVIPFYLLFSHRGYLAIYHYFRHRHKYGVWKSFRYTCLNHYRFGQVIMDRFASYAGQKYHFVIDGNENFLRLLHSPDGFVIISSHVGSYEMAGYTFQSVGKTYNALVYSGESAAVMENRKRLLTENNIRMIPVSDDMSHIFAINEALSEGNIVSIPGDRVFGSPRTVECELLGGKVQLPYGPYALAAQRGVPVIAIYVMKEAAYRYHVYIHQLNMVREDDHRKRDEKVNELVHRFTETLESVLRKYPEQWFNYFDFWHEDGQ